MLTRPRTMRGQAGDTIVEVMIVFTVLAFAIGISYTTANKSLQATRQSQENTQATQLAQSQLEYLRYLAPDTANSNVFVSQPFCMSESGSGPSITPFSNTSTYSSYPSTCIRGIYHLSVLYCGDANANAACSGLFGSDIFLSRVIWDDISGSGQATVTLTMRVHP